MKNLKFAALLAAAMAVGAAKADDSYLYWMVGSDVTYGTLAGSLAGSPAIEGDIEDYYAKVMTDDGTYLMLYGVDGKPASEALAINSTGRAYFSSDSTFSSFVFELYNDSDERVGWSVLPYSSAKDYIYGDPTYGAGTATYGVANLIPEPSSGLLLLLGLAGLGLRRRRAQAA